MTPKILMIMGAMIGGVGILTELVIPQSGAGILIFASGALFGKGYGAWEYKMKSTITKSGKNRYG